jgi:hypothetical protein
VDFTFTIGWATINFSMQWIELAKWEQYLKKKIEFNEYQTYYVVRYHTYLWMEVMK